MRFFAPSDYKNLYPLCVSVSEDARPGTSGVSLHQRYDQRRRKTVKKPSSKGRNRPATLPPRTIIPAVPNPGSHELPDD